MALIPSSSIASVATSLVTFLPMSEKLTRSKEISRSRRRMAVFALIQVLDVDDTNGAWVHNLAICRARRARDLHRVRHGGCNAVVASASVNGTCKV